MTVSNLTEKRVKNIITSTISDYLLECACSSEFSNSDILAADDSKFNLLFKQSLLMKRDKPVLNRTVQSFLLK